MVCEKRGGEEKRGEEKGDDEKRKEEEKQEMKKVAVTSECSSSPFNMDIRATVNCIECAQFCSQLSIGIQLIFWYAFETTSALVFLGMVLDHMCERLDCMVRLMDKVV